MSGNAALKDEATGGFAAGGRRGGALDPTVPDPTQEL